MEGLGVMSSICKGVFVNLLLLALSFFDLDLDLPGESRSLIKHHLPEWKLSPSPPQIARQTHPLGFKIRSTSFLQVFCLPLIDNSFTGFLSSP